MDPAKLPVWNFDGSSTEQAPGKDSEVLMVPCAVYKDPFRAGPSGKSNDILVLCDCYKPDPDAPNGVGEAIPTNTRVKCAMIMEKIKSEIPWFGIEQEYTLFEPDGVTPYGWPQGGEPGAQVCACARAPRVSEGGEDGPGAGDCEGRARGVRRTWRAGGI
eukprot:730313-Prymnesium_polylepis.1